MRYLKYLTAILFINLVVAQGELPEGFVNIKKHIPSIIVEAKYYSTDNFMGVIVDGYKANVCVLSNEAADALKHVQEELAEFGLGLKVFDGYRPQKAVDHFVRWAKNLSDTLMKKNFYPEVDKKNLFRDGYIASKSGHSRGSTIDLTIINLSSGKGLDMGTDFDYFGVESWGKNASMKVHQRSNRLLLRSLMLKNGFKPYEKEWWHFTLKNEPYKNKYFNFEVK